MITQYSPLPPPHDPQDPLVSYVYSELRQLSLKLGQAVVFTPLHVAPTKAQEGEVQFADGTDWNPGAGKGLYVYYSSTWNKLG